MSFPSAAWECVSPSAAWQISVPPPNSESEVESPPCRPQAPHNVVMSFPSAAWECVLPSAAWRISPPPPNSESEMESDAKRRFAGRIPKRRLGTTGEGGAWERQGGRRLGTTGGGTTGIQSPAGAFRPVTLLRSFALFAVWRGVALFLWLPRRAFPLRGRCLRRPRPR